MDETITTTAPNEPKEDLFIFYIVTVLSFYSASIPTLVSLLLNLFIWDTQVEASLKRQVSDLKEELGSVSMTDEFAKYSKIQRKLNKASDELKNKSNNQLIYHTKAKMILYAIFYLISFICFITLNWNYYGKPILYLSDNILYPFGTLIGFPTGQSNCLSTVTWSFISGYVFRICIQNWS